MTTTSRARGRASIRAAGLIILFALTAGCGTDKGPGSDAAATPAEPAPAAGQVTRIRYASWQETIDIDAARRTIVQTLTEYEYPNPVSGTPSRSRTRTVLDGMLTPEQIDALQAFVGESGFMALKPAYGAPDDQRYYPYAITVHVGGRKPKEVVYRSNPSYEEMPEPFRKLEAYLQELCKAVPGKTTPPMPPQGSPPPIVP
ncbi:MAG: hypothetical protein JXR37_24225 [Kiritimatiellae bacterium]|nr:hypothetical protein [Kiritimatiellia bacterium]